MTHVTANIGSAFWNPFTILLLMVVAVWLVLKLVPRLLGRRLRKEFLEGFPRWNVMSFVERVRKLTFDDPVTLVRILFSNTGEARVKLIWREAGTARSPLQRPEDGPMRDTGLSLRAMRLPTGHLLAVIQLPEPERHGEAYFLGIALPDDVSLEHDLDRARRSARFFYLDRFGGPDSSRNTDFCEKRWPDRTFTYNVGTGRAVEGFVRAIQEKLAVPSAALAGAVARAHA